MSTLGIVVTYAGAFVLGCGLALVYLLAMRRRERRIQAEIAKADRLWKVQHFKP